jgi:hypothetical protein
MVLTTLAPSGHVRHASITVEPCETHVKTTYDVLVTEKPPLSVADAAQFTRLTTLAKDAGETTITIKKDARGWPVGFQMSGDTNGPDPISAMIFLMRQPLWAPDGAKTDWKATIYSPFDPQKPLQISCHLSRFGKGLNHVRLEQKSTLITIAPDMRAEFSSTLEFDSLHGKEGTFQVKIGINSDLKSGQLMQFDEKD